MVETIGQLDYILSRLLLISEQDIDEINWRTMKHHAEDMGGAAKKILENLQETLARHPEWMLSKRRKRGMDLQSSTSQQGLSPEEREAIDQTP